MRVALVHHALSRSGGMESYLVDLVKGFAQAGDSVDVWVRQLDRSLAGELGVKARQVARLPLPRLVRNWAFALEIEREQLRERYDLAISLARTAGQHVAVNGGTHPGFLAAMGKPASLKDRIEIRLERRGVLASGHVVAHSAMLARELSAYYAVDPARMQVLYPPIDTRRFERRRAARRSHAREELGLRPGDFAFVFPSMSHERKGLPALLAAFARLQDPRALLLVAGRVSGAQANGVRLRELGYVKDMPALYAAADCTVLPSRYEPFGLAVAESLQCGTPAIASAASGVAELMDEDDGVRLAATDAESIAAALRQVLERRYQPAPDFARRHGLEIAPHVAALRALAGA
ncbi:MAG: glycosyltransferase family 4 protein [Nevskia sp.]|nr:glycosyltransferase family 4 protein [Nevskia sp.]